VQIDKYVRNNNIMLRALFVSLGTLIYNIELSNCTVCMLILCFAFVKLNLKKLLTYLLNVVDCRYIYCETANVTIEIAFPLMYAAKKYLLAGLVRRCRKTLLNLLGVDNVCTVLEQSMSLDENELKAKCLEFIDSHAIRVFSREEFLHLSGDALKEIICRDTLAHTNERQVYEKCVKWATIKLRESGNESPSGEEIREQLGSVLCMIRFPTMTPRDFAELTALSSVLTAEEQRDVYVYMILGTKLESLKFLTETRRRKQETVISRFNEIIGEWTCEGLTDAICIESTVNMYLTGVGLYGGKEESNHDVTIAVLNKNETLCTTVTKMTSDGGQRPLKIELANPVYIPANTRHTVTAVLKGPRTWRGAWRATPGCAPPGCVSFYHSELCTNGSRMNDGQIPQLFYCLE